MFIKKLAIDEKSFEDVVSLTVHCESRCVQWNPNNQNLLAAGLFNGNVVIYDNLKQEVLQVLSGSEERVLCLQWHP